jgi:hypothetical protein
MTCHSQIFTNSPLLEPVRTSFAEDRSIEWTRVHDLPDFAHFDHSSHVRKGVGCVTCHGRIDRMPLVRQVATLQMAWCLDCHRHPERDLRSLEAVFDMTSESLSDEPPQGDRDRAGLVRMLLNCSTCHQ